MEGEGPMGEYFDKINDDPYMSADTFEKGESKLQKQALLMLQFLHIPCRMGGRKEHTHA